MERLPLEQRARSTATPFAELNDLLTRFVTRVSSILGTKLVGVYLTGSFALGAGDAASDCDFDDELWIRLLHGVARVDNVCLARGLRTNQPR